MAKLGLSNLDAAALLDKYADTIPEDWFNLVSNFTKRLPSFASFLNSFTPIHPSYAHPYQFIFEPNREPNIWNQEDFPTLQEKSSNSYHKKNKTNKSDPKISSNNQSSSLSPFISSFDSPNIQYYPNCINPVEQNNSTRENGSFDPSSNSFPPLSSGPKSLPPILPNSSPIHFSPPFPNPYPLHGSTNNNSKDTALSNHLNTIVTLFNSLLTNLINSSDNACLHSQLSDISSQLNSIISTLPIVNSAISK